MIQHTFVFSIFNSVLRVLNFYISLRMYKSVDSFMESCLNFMQHIEMDASNFLCAQGLPSEESDLPEKVSKRKCLNSLINHFQCSVFSSIFFLRFELLETVAVF